MSYIEELGKKYALAVNELGVAIANEIEIKENKKELKGIYLGACRAWHPNYNLDYNDIVAGYHINIIEDMMKVDLNCYDYIIASPPCNYYSRARGNRLSAYAAATKHLLPDILKKVVQYDKPFLIENVINYKLMQKEGIFDFCVKHGIIYYFFGRHTYFTNIMFNPIGCLQRQDFKNHGYRINYDDEMSKYSQGGFNVHQVIEWWLKCIH